MSTDKADAYRVRCDHPGCEATIPPLLEDELVDMLRDLGWVWVPAGLSRPRRGRHYCPDHADTPRDTPSFGVAVDNRDPSWRWSQADVVAIIAQTQLVAITPGGRWDQWLGRCHITHAVLADDEVFLTVSFDGLGVLQERYDEIRAQFEQAGWHASAAWSNVGGDATVDGGRVALSRLLAIWPAPAVPAADPEPALQVADGGFFKSELALIEPIAPALWQDGAGNWWATSELGPGEHEVPSRHVMLTGDRPGRWETFDKIVARTGVPRDVVGPSDQESLTLREVTDRYERQELDLRRRMAAALAYVNDPGNWSAFDGRRKTIEGLLTGEVPGDTPPTPGPPMSELPMSESWWDTIRAATGTRVHVNTRWGAHTGRLTHVDTGHLELTVIHRDPPKIVGLIGPVFDTERRRLIPREDILTIDLPPAHNPPPQEPTPS